MGMMPVLLLTIWRNKTMPSAEALLLGVLPGMLLLMALGWSVAVLVGMMNVHFRDTRHITDIAMQLFWYLTPVMYPNDFMRDRFLGRLMATYNPLMPFLRLVRDSVLTNQVPQMSAYASACMIVAVAVSFAGIALWNEERRLIFHL
jgi:ABC-type polysaccharide/polyol phosphate export permease